MEPKTFKGGKGPEDLITAKVIPFLEAKGWKCKRIIGCALQSGLPDWYITHRSYGGRWVEIKNPAKYHFTTRQWEVLPEMMSHGTHIYIMTEASEEEYKILFQPGNLHRYLGYSKRWH